MAIAREIAQDILETERAVRRAAGGIVTDFLDVTGVTVVARGFVVPVDGGDSTRPRDQSNDVDLTSVRLKFVPRTRGGIVPERNQLVMIDGNRRRVLNVEVVKKAARFSHALVDVTS